MIKFCDEDPNRYVPSTDQILAEITPHTKALLIPNLLGNKPDWKELKTRLIDLRQEDIILIEDSCDTMTFTEESDISTVSFDASHVITAGGMGGMVMFNDKKYYDKAIRLRDWGRVGDNSEEVEGRFKADSLAGDIQCDWKFFYPASYS